MKCDPDDSAFPKPADDESAYQWGLDKREFFAALALQGVLRAGPAVSANMGPEEAPEEIANEAAWAVAYADALINTLNAKE